MERKNTNSLDLILEEISPLEQEITDSKMLLATRIADVMEAKGWKNEDLRVAVGIDDPLVIEKWLSGTYEFSREELEDISRVIGGQEAMLFS